MRSKHFLIVLFLILAMFLSGCGVVTDEEKIRDIIDEYFLAVIGQDWDKAKSYCIYDSEIYYETCDLEDYIDSLYLYSSFVDISFEVDIFDVIVIGDSASAYIDGFREITGDFMTGRKYYSEYFYLQKISNDWKLNNW